MYKHTYRIFGTLAKKVHNSVLLSTTSYVNNNLIIIPMISTIPLNAFTCNITKRFSTKTAADDESELKPYIDLSNLNNPSMLVNKKIQDDAQMKHDKLLDSDPEYKKLCCVIELEIDLMRQSGGKVPCVVRPTDWLQIMKLNSQNRRRAYLEFLWVNELKRNKQKTKSKTSLQCKDEEEKEEVKEETHLKYGLNHNTMFHRIYKTSMNAQHNSKLIHAIMFGEKLVLDCGFESEMKSPEISSCAKQIMFSFVANRENFDPFDILLCNIDLEGELMTRLRSFFPTMDEPGYPFQYTSKSYLEFFPKKDLVYLTPHTQNVLQGFTADKVYIIGALVDKSHSKPLSLAKAKEEGIAVAKFPLDNYLDFSCGSNKNLNVNHCTQIMLDIKNTNNWEYAFRAVPSRKIVRNFTEYERPKTAQSFTNVQPKFRSGHATRLSDAAYQKLKSLKYNQEK